MTDPLRRLKLLPWRSLLLVSVFTVVICTLLDSLIRLAYSASPGIAQALSILFAPPLILFLVIAVSIGIGALAVEILERFAQRVIINSGSLWALVLCLLVILYVKSLLPLPALLVNFSEIQLVGVIVGVFWKGRPHWRWR